MLPFYRQLCGKFKEVLKKCRGFLAFTKKYGILLLLVLRRMNSAQRGQAMYGASAPHSAAVYEHR